LSERPFRGDYDTDSVKLNSSFLYYHDEGVSRDSAIILLHGRNSHSGTWRKNAGHISKETGWRVIAPSLSPWRGEVEEIQIANYVKTVDELLSELKIENAILVGNSMGGWIAMRLAAMRKSVRALVLEDSAGGDKSTTADDFRALNASKLPILIIWGKEDEVLPLVDGEKTHSELKNSELLVLNGIGHVPHWEAPEEFDRLVVGFVVNSKLMRS
jgi:pimeloyl-ACP methyl ester carboxylesterase